uniref:Uncharacterized protein n=1 Tax=Globodera rostochiensis TaxID=31243 RepID=A0A914HKK4_GLORO
MIGAIIAICCQTKGPQQRLAPTTVAGNARDANASAEDERNLNLNKWPGTRTATKRQNTDQIILAPLTEKEFAKNENQHYLNIKETASRKPKTTDEINVETIGGIVIIHSKPKAENLDNKNIFGTILKCHPMHPQYDQTHEESPKIEQYASSELTVTHELEGVRYSSLSEIESTVSTTIFRNNNSEEPKHNEDEKNLQKSTEFTSSILLDALEATMEKQHSNFSTNQ